MVKIKIPKNSDGKKFTSRWRYCVGTGRLGLALQKEYIDTLKFVKENIDFKYIRGHGLLCDDVGIYREDVVGNDVRPFYNFTYIDRIFDSFLELGIRPFVEVGFMPKKLASGTQTVFYWEGNVTPPKDYEKWSNLIKAVVSHFISRYGIDEVVKWPFEIWNEPNLKEFWKDADQKEYFKLYKVTAKAIKEVNENLQVGGPAICGGSDYWIEDFLNFCNEENVPIDFVSRHAYTSKQGEYTPHLIYQEIMPSEYMLNEFKSVREIIRNSPFPNLPFHITEYNTSYSPLNPVHDTPFNAAYLARILSEGGDYVDSFSYWTFSDVFEEKDVPRSQFHGGFGLVALNKIPKPTFHMFKFFNSMGEEVLYRDEHMLITRRDDGSIALIAWNEIMEKTENPDKEYELEIPVGFKDVFIKKQMIDEDHGNPWGTWIHMGRPRFPSKEQIRTLRDIARPKIKTGRVISDDGYINLKFKLGKNAVALFELTEVIDESSTYIGLDDSKINGY
ncbi:GH39 family glycosyl hydrolase [Thermoanaerobacterium thermosaccharolyticum]|uniref:GH39 family glycosyl hydrolase n=1 Tax=Thermoanaerobacterium thermosaccharolyticum TaxID=1517 RepID=UPI00123C63B5|nr:xylan 1,4-beta-xylosidase [Thermoanaerobacterium thermosaccharolyticum]KAA5806418.1 xylan 1,4-beta-xylosidase [Thermoanaerobacterium thermosaccharolyticum]